ncbi:MAG: hypothetical protein ACT4PV_16220 [Planctomycetaceae bacterium]
MSGTLSPESGFDEAVRGLVKGSPWWMISLAVHAVALFVLYSLDLETRGAERTASVQAVLPETPVPPEEQQPPTQPETPPIQPVVEPDVIREDPETVGDESEVPFDSPMGEEGRSEGPILGAWDNPSIGLDGGPGGKPKGPGGPVSGSRHAGPEDCKDAVELGLEWLAKHQDVGGGGMWDCDDFMKHDPASDRCDGPGKAHYDPGVTGLALLAFLGAGYTDRGNEKSNRFARNVRAGLRYLMSIQDDEGCFGPRASQHFIYNHVIATLAMCEAFWMTRNPAYRMPAQEGLGFTAMARNPYLAWRYNIRGGENDTSVTGWCVMAIKSGKFAGLDVDVEAFEGARLWIDKMTDPDTGRVGYLQAGGGAARPEGMQDRFPAEMTESMTAAGILTRIFLGEDPRTSDPIRRGVDLCLRRLPTWNTTDGSIDMVYWYYATLALFQVGGEPWRRWNQAIQPAMVRSQHPRGSGRREGSWDPIDPWGPDGGRVYSTAVMVTCLEVYYRYDRVFNYNR